MYKAFLKRCVDIICSSVFLIISSPIMLIVLLLIKLDGKGSVFFIQTRVGKNAKPFKIYKFRTMLISTPNMPTSLLENSDKYITKIGKILRKTSIDEFPQVFNVLKGDMSFVGPRPVIESEKELIEKRIESGVYSLLPGLTGLAQINGRDKVSVIEKVKYDKEYLDNISPWLDIKIMFSTIFKLFQTEDKLEEKDQDENCEKKPKIS
ncbi:MAG: sugar transferase [Oscillospiraceae bacterium]|nr:sugar transferase [Oscillospiraceae bacterium]